MLDELFEIIIDFVIEFFVQTFCDKKMPLALRVILSLLIGLGILATGVVFMVIGMADAKTWMTVLGAAMVLIELGILLGVLRHRRKEKDILY